jgi:Fic family protein
MYTPKFTISNEILRNIGNIEACREVIDNAPLVPVWEKQFQQEALERTIHYGTHIEGNELTFNEAVRILEGHRVAGRERDIQEVINYRNTMKYIDEIGREGERAREQEKERKYTEEQLKKIHQLTCEKILEPEECGHYRTKQVILRNSATGEIVFRPPPHPEVPYLIEAFLNWLNFKEAKEIHPVIRAAIANYILVDIHPFIEGNGRTSRAFATLVLFVEGYDIKKLFSLEEHFDKDAVTYFGTLQLVTKQASTLETRDLTAWIEYYSKCLAIELSRMKDKVKRLSVDVKLKGKLGKQVALSERQIKIVEYLEENGEVITVDARRLIPMVSADTVLRDLKDLMEKGIVKKVGKTKSAKYILNSK